MVGASGAACLTCGVVTLYLEDAALAKVRAWNRKAGGEKADDE